MMSKRDPNMALLRLDTDLSHCQDSEFPLGGLPTPESSVCDGRRSSIVSSLWSFEPISSSTSPHPSRIESYQSPHCSQEPTTPPQHGFPTNFSFTAPDTAYESFSLTADLDRRKSAYTQRQTLLPNSPSPENTSFDFRSESEWDYCTDQRHAYGAQRLPHHATDSMMPVYGDFTSAIGVSLDQSSQSVDQRITDSFSYPRTLNQYETLGNLAADDSFRTHFQVLNQASNTIPPWPSAIELLFPSSMQMDSNTIVPKETIMHETFSRNVGSVESLDDKGSEMLSPSSDWHAIKDEDVSAESHDNWHNGARRRVVFEKYGAKRLKKEEKLSSMGWTGKQKRGLSITKRRSKNTKTFSALRTLNGASVSICYQEYGKSKIYACTHIHADRNRCSRAFARVEHLRRHQKTHSGVREYRCPKCRKEFDRRDNWRDHLRTHLSQAVAGRNERMTFEEMFEILRNIEEPEEAQKTIASLQKWRESGRHLSKGGISTSARSS